MDDFLSGLIAVAAVVIGLGLLAYSMIYGPLI